MSILCIDTGVDLLARCRRLKELGVDEKLEELKEDPDRDVRDRAASALDQLNELLDEAGTSS